MICAIGYTVGKTTMHRDMGVEAMDERTMEQALEAAKGMTFEKFWALLMEDRRQMLEREEAERKAREEREEAERKAQAERDELLAEMKRSVGKISNTIGEMTEAMFAAAIKEKFNEIGYQFTKTGHHTEFFEGKNAIAEADFFLENGDYAIPVEVKTRLTIERVNRHLERMGRIRGYMDARNDRRTLLGVVAGGIVAEEVIAHAHREGFYVVLLSGETLKIAEPPDGFQPREW